jgi:hypothetical protein
MHAISIHSTERARVQRDVSLARLGLTAIGLNVINPQGPDEPHLKAT